MERCGAWKMEGSETGRLTGAWMESGGGETGWAEVWMEDGGSEAGCGRGRGWNLERCGGLDGREGG